MLEPMLFLRKKEVEISVVDKAGRPLADRTIACITDALGHSLATGTTDEQGIATVRYDSQGVPDQFREQGRWVITEQGKSLRSVDSRNLQRLTVKQESPKILALEE